MTSNYYNPADPNLIYLQSRAETDPALIEEYAEMMAAGAQFPACKAIGEQNTLYIYDGYHRGQAAQKASLPLLVSVKPGTRAEAEWLALAANQEHGLRRSNADKQKIVRLALAHEFGSKLSDRQLAAHCGVSDKTVGKIRAELVATAEIPQSATRIGADGREINVGNIGGQPPAYVAIWQLEQALSGWMNRIYTYGLQSQIDALEGVKQKTVIGIGMLETLTTKDILPGPRRKGDVLQACNNLLSQLQQKKWREGRAERIRQMICICGEQTLFPVGEMDELTCSACRRSWNSVHSFENTCRGCEKDLTTTLRVEGEQYCSDCWDERSAGHTANRAWRCITQTAETCYLCGKEAIYHNNGWRGKPGADFHLCNKHYTEHRTAVTGHTDAAELQAALDQLKQADPDTASCGLACPHCGHTAVQAADGSLKCINVDCESWWKNLIAYQAAVAGPTSAQPDDDLNDDEAAADWAELEQLEKEEADAIAQFEARSKAVAAAIAERPQLDHLSLKTTGFPRTCPTGQAAPTCFNNCTGCEFHRYTTHAHWVCYHPSHQEPDTANFREQLSRALQANSDRWVKHRQTGLSNTDLVELIGHTFGLGGSSSFPGEGYGYKGGKEPKFWLGKGWPHAKPTLAGAALRDAARELLSIPFPGDAADGEGDYDFTGMTTADLEAGLAAIERDGLPLDSPHARRLREELAARKAVPVPAYTLRSDLTYRCQRAGIRFGALLDKIKTTDQADRLDRALADLENELAGDTAKISEVTR